MRDETRVFYNGVIERVLLYVQDNIDDELSCKKLSDVACVSQYHFFRMFEVYTGETIGEYIRRIRLEKAAYLLKHSKRSVIDVALSTGFASHQSFCRTFRTVYGMAPRTFRSGEVELRPIDAPTRLHIAEFGGISRFVPLITGGIRMEMSIKQVSDLTVVYLEHTGAYNTVGATWEKMNAWADEHKEIITNDTLFLTEYLDDPSIVPENKLRSHICVTVPTNFTPGKGMRVKTIPGGKYAVGRYVGPYTKLGEAWHDYYAEGLASIKCTSKHTPCFEVYINGPHEVPADQLITDIYEAVE